MLVSELRELLRNYPDDMEIHTAYNYGDYWRTTVAPKVTGVFEGAVVHSDYHQMDKLVELDDDETDSDARTVLILE